MNIFPRFPIAVVCILAAASALWAEDNTTPKTTESNEVTYHGHIAPVVRKYCVGCHNDADADLAGELSFESLQGLQAKTDKGPLLVPGKTDESRLLALVRGTAEPKMPPEDEPQPSAAEIELLADWIGQGMPVGEPPAKDKWEIDVPEIQPQSDIRPISAMAVHAASGTLAVGRYAQVSLFDIREDGSFDINAPRQVLEQLPGKVTALHFSHDGTQLVAASGVTGLGGYASIFNVSTGKLIREFQGHADILYDAELSQDGKVLATCGYDQKIVLWDAATGQKLRELTGHNGAVYDVGFSPDSQFLVSGSADDTCKVWRVADGARLDTLPQPLKEVYACAFSPDGKTIVAGGADNNLRVWRFVSTDGPKINPMIFARFAHEGPVQRIAFNEDGSRLISVANDLTVKLWDTRDYQELFLEDGVQEVAMAAAWHVPSSTLALGGMNGNITSLKLPRIEREPGSVEQWAPPRLGSGPSMEISSTDDQEANDTPQSAQQVVLPAGIQGTIHNEADGPDVDFYRFTASQGQTWVLEVKAARDGSPLDSHLAIFHPDGTPVERVKLQAVRDSYFTFRGKDDSTSDDFRVFNWEEMKLNQYLYSSGEVVRLWLHPRGPDSGFRVYPGQGKRWNFFDTTPLAHALGEPCYIVEPHAPEAEIVPNGLPVFTVYYENDDESRRAQGRDSRLYFTAPADGDYLVKISDVRGFEGEKYRYQLDIRPLAEDFRVNLADKDLQIAAGSAREMRFTVNRQDRFDGPIEIHIEGLPEGFQATSPVIIEEGQIEAMGVIHAEVAAAAPAEEAIKQIKIRASATINDEVVTHDVAGPNKLGVREKPKLALKIVPAESAAQPIAGSGTMADPFQFNIRPGETIMLKLLAERNGDNGNINFGKEGSGRNLPFAVNVANIGLNGLLLPSGQNEREFFITADEVAQPTSRLFHLNTGSDGGHATIPVLLHVLPE